MAMDPWEARSRSGKMDSAVDAVSTEAALQSSNQTRKGLPAPLRAPASPKAPRLKRSWASKVPPAASVRAKWAI